MIKTLFAATAMVALLTAGGFAQAATVSSTSTGSAMPMAAPANGAVGASSGEHASSSNDPKTGMARTDSNDTRADPKTGLSNTHIPKNATKPH